MQAREWQFDGLVGPTHNYAGLAMGNMASAKNAGAVSNPKKAALQGLSKMRLVRDLGMPQAFLPPHYRPALRELHRLGFRGSVGHVLDEAARQAPGLLAAVFSSSFMWAANAATVTPSADSGDGKLHLTPANLVSHFHRAMEADFHRRSLNTIFHNEKLFSIHNYLKPVDILGDEGAANHMRVVHNNSKVGTHLFIYGKSHEMTFIPQRFRARQERLASESIARLHGLQPDACLFLQQAPEVIDQGVFHHDVIGMNTTSRMIVHAEAFIPEHRGALQKFFADHPELRLREVSADELSVGDAVSSYLFNSQLLDLRAEEFALIAPSECENHAGVRELIARLNDEGMLQQVHYLDVRESMRNGGGPACLRLRVVLTEEEAAAMHQGVVMENEKFNILSRWIEGHYRDRLQFDNFRDPQFVNELDDAYAALEALIGMPGLYDLDRN